MPLENEVFVGISPQDTHGEYADEQLITIQKRICLIEFLIMVGLLFVKEASEKSEWDNYENLKKSTKEDFFDFRYWYCLSRERWG